MLEGFAFTNTYLIKRERKKAIYLTDYSDKKTRPLEEKTCFAFLSEVISVLIIDTIGFLDRNEVPVIQTEFR